MPTPWRIILGLLAVLACSPASAAESDVCIIAHLDVPIDELSRGSILDFYTGDIRQWSDGSPVVLFDQEDNDTVRDRFFSFLGKSSSRMRTLWMKRMLAGEGEPPATYGGDSAMVAAVASTPSAIGFAQRSAVTDDVKVLLVIPEREP